MSQLDNRNRSCKTITARSAAMATGFLVFAPAAAGLGQGMSYAHGAMAVRGQASTGTGALPEPLTIDDAVRLGLARNPQTSAFVAAVQAAAGTYHSLAAFPPLALGVTSVTGNSTAPTLNGAVSDTFVDAGDTLDTSGQRRYQAASARALVGVARYQLGEAALMLTQQIRDAYWTLVAARAQAQVAQETLGDVQKVNQLTTTQFQAGNSPQVDVIRSSIDVANSEQAYVSAQAAERTALIALNQLLVRPSGAPVSPADSLAETTVTPTPIPRLQPVDQLVAEALSRRPLIAGARAQSQSARYTVKQLQASRFPDVSVDYERSLRDPSYSVLAAIHFPLLDFGSIGNSIRSAEASEQGDRALEIVDALQVKQQVAQAYSDYTTALQQAGKYQTDILQPSVTLLGMAQIGYKQGGTGLLPVIDAETTLRNARNGYIGALLALYKADDEILAVTGAPVPIPPAAAGVMPGTPSDSQTRKR